MIGVRRALLFSSGDRYVVLALQFATIAAVSRILTPGEIGVSVVGMAVVGIAMTLREFASASFIIQRRDLRPVDIRSGFTVMLGLTTGIVLVLALAAPLLAEAYGEQNLVLYLRVICVCLFVELFWSQIVTLLRRELAFGRVAAINFASAAVASVTTILLALNGFSYMSFAWAWLAAATAAGLLAFCIRPDLSVFVPSLGNWREMVEFGGYNGANVLLYKIFEQVPYLVIGRFISADAAGLLSRSLMISQLPDKVALGGASAVALPVFAVAAREGRCLRDLYLKGLEWATGLLWPAHLVLAILAYPIVDLLLGPQWHGAAQLVQIIAMASLFAFGFELNYPVLVAVGAISRCLPPCADRVSIGGHCSEPRGDLWRPSCYRVEPCRGHSAQCLCRSSFRSASARPPVVDARHRGPKERTPGACDGGRTGCRRRRRRNL